ncbi:MAG: PadR family transcriptional regulator [Bacteroidota bacterium]
MEKDSISSQEEVILLLVGNLQPNAYAYTLKNELKEQLNRNVSLASIHTILYRMEKHGFLKSSMGGVSSSRGGRSKRLYQLTSKGFTVVAEIRLVRNNLWDGISPNQFLTSF